MLRRPGRRHVCVTCSRPTLQRLLEGTAEHVWASHDCWDASSWLQLHVYQTTPTYPTPSLLVVFLHDVNLYHSLYRMQTLFSFTLWAYISHSLCCTQTSMSSSSMLRTCITHSAEHKPRCLPLCYEPVSLTLLHTNLVVFLYAMSLEPPLWRHGACGWKLRQWTRLCLDQFCRMIHTVWWW